MPAIHESGRARRALAAIFSIVVSIAVLLTATLSAGSKAVSHRTIRKATGVQSKRNSNGHREGDRHELVEMSQGSDAWGGVDDDDDDRKQQLWLRNDYQEHSIRERRQRQLLWDLPLLRGGSGLDFDRRDNTLYHPQMISREILRLNPETGQVLERIQDNVNLVNDVVVAPDGTLYWTVLVMGTLYQRPAGGGPTVELFPPFSFPSANGIAMSDDGKRLFFSQCFNIGHNGVFQYTIETKETVQIGANDWFCAGNSLAYHNEALYGTLFFGGKVFKMDISAGDLANPVLSDVTTVLPFPGGLGFDSTGRLHAVDGVTGDLYRVDIDNKDVSGNAELLATLPGPLESVAFDKDDRLYVSGFFSGTVWEVQSSTEFRVVID